MQLNYRSGIQMHLTCKTDTNVQCVQHPSKIRVQFGDKTIYICTQHVEDYTTDSMKNAAFLSKKMQFSSQCSLAKRLG